MRHGLGATLLAVLLLVQAVGVASAGMRCPERPIVYAFYEAPVLFEAGRGLEKDLFDEIRARSGCRFEVRVMPRARIWPELEAGRLDMATTVLRTPEREASLWILDYLQLRNYLLVRKPEADKLGSLDDFERPGNALRVGQVRGYVHGPEFDGWLKRLAMQGRVHEVMKAEQLFGMLRAGHIEAVGATPLTYRAALAEQQMADRVAIFDWGGPGAASPRGLGLSKSNFSEAEALEWQRLLDGLRRDGTVRRLIGRYMGKAEADAMMLP